jgi:ubiquinone/menaquinone biosynthesis C-methylase UbiE
MEGGVEKRKFSSWRKELWSRVRGKRLLEVGIGTGKNMSSSPEGTEVTAVDLSPRMLEQARKRAANENVSVELIEADAQELPFPEASFDAAIATFVFCSVPNLLLGLKEICRVFTAGGQLLLLEHMLPHKPLLEPLMHIFNPVGVRMTGAHIDRETVENVRRAGFEDLRVEDLWLDIVKLIEVRAPDQET